MKERPTPILGVGRFFTNLVNLPNESYKDNRFGGKGTYMEELEKPVSSEESEASEEQDQPKETPEEEEPKEDEKPDDAEGQPEDEGKEEKKEEKTSEPTELELIELPDGTKVTYEELLKGQMRDRDYRKKTMELADLRRQLEQTRTPAPREPEAPTTQEEEFDQGQLAILEKMARKLGFVKAEELAHRETIASRDSILNAFLESHPEYKAENDPDNLKYNALTDELSLYDRSDVKKLARVLEKAHGSVANKFSSTAEALKKAARFQSGVKAASLGSGASAAPSQSTETDSYTSDQIDVMKKMGVWE